MTNIPIGDILIMFMVLLQAGAVISYMVKSDYYEAVLWFGAAVGNVGYLLMRFK